MTLFVFLLSIGLFMGLMWLGAVYPSFARACRIAFLGAWGVFTYGAPIAATILALHTDHIVTTAIASAAFIAIFGTFYRFLGWAPLLDALRGGE